MKFISSMVARTGQEYNATDIARDVEIDADTVSNLILTNTYIIFLLQSHINKHLLRKSTNHFVDFREVLFSNSRRSDKRICSSNRFIIYAILLYITVTTFRISCGTSISTMPN